MPGFLETKRLILRPLSESDADGPYPGWLNDAATCAGNSHHVYPFSRAQAAAYITAAQTGSNKVLLAIDLKDSGQHVGNISLQRIHPVNRSAELAILIGDPACRGTGIGYEACEALVQHGFNALNLHRISLGTFASNSAMQRVAEKLGFTKEGVQRQAAFKEGAYVDIVLYGLLEEEFRKR